MLLLRKLNVLLGVLVLCQLHGVAMATRYSDREQEADDSFRTVAMTIEHVRRYVNISNTPLEELLQAGNRLFTSRAPSYTLYDLPRISQSGDERTASAVRQTFYNGLKNATRSNESYWEEDAERGPVRGNQVRGYEGCRRDYSSIAESFTDRIQRLVHRRICNDDPTACTIPPPDGIGQVPAEVYKNRTSFAFISKLLLLSLYNCPHAITAQYCSYC
jgi:hypothetical protein